MSPIVWEDPPKVEPVHKGLWARRVRPAMERPGVWARVFECSPRQAGSHASHLRNNYYGIPDGHWEFDWRGIDGVGYVYARYLGPEESP